MKQPLLTVGILFTGYICSAQQNLAPNYSFEYFTSCPVGWGGNVEKAVPWFNPTDNSPDYFNKCQTTGGLGTPNNFFGTQYARTGNAYAGGMPHYSTSNGRDYIEIALMDTLTSGHKYLGEFWISLADSMRWAIDKIGMCFTTNVITSTDLYVLPCNPQIENLSDNILRDTANWVLISGEFIADSGEKYLTIGNFKPDSLTQIDTAGDFMDGKWWLTAYYYIDDVSVYCVDSGYTTADAGTDKLICKGDSVQLGTPAQSGFTYSWSPTYGMDPVAGLDSAGVTQAQPWVKPQKTTTYILTVVDTVSNCKGPGRDSVTVTVVDTGVCFVGVKEFEVHPDLLGTKFKIYPNPSNGTMQLDYVLEEGDQGYLVIYNILGKSEIKYPLDPEKRKLIISEKKLNDGVYFYEVIINNNIEIKDKLLIIR